jgi:hypothetical protein
MASNQKPVAVERRRNVIWVRLLCNARNFAELAAVDRDGVRFQLNEFCCRQGLPLVDAASDTVPTEQELLYGGRVCVATPETGCLACQGVLSQEEIRADQASPERRADEAAIYGVPRGALGDGGPSVVSVNGVVGSLAVTEFMVLVTGLRQPFAQLDYWGHAGNLRKVRGREEGCFYCGLRPSSAGKGTDPSGGSAGPGSDSGGAAGAPRVPS